MIFWFDDGLKSVLDVAYPIMKQHGLVGTVAVIPSRVGYSQIVDGNEYPCMTISDLQFLISEGWSIASHSYTHPQPDMGVGTEFCGLTLLETERELKASKEWIKEHLGLTPTIFVAPRHFLRRDQMELARKYYNFVRSFPLGFPEGHIVFHHIKSERWFRKRLRRIGIV